MFHSKKLTVWLKRHRFRKVSCRYRRKPHHQKKVREGNRKEWWEHKKFIRDKSRSYWVKGCTRYYKVTADKQERSWIRQQLHRGNWDEMPSNNLKKYRYDWW